MSALSAVDFDPEEATYSSLLSSGAATPAQVDQMRSLRKHKNLLSISRRALLQQHYVHDVTLTRCALTCSAAAALEGLGRREEAVHLLRHRRFMEEEAYSSSDSDSDPSSPASLAHSPTDSASYDIALSKLLFKADSKPAALALTLSVCDLSASSPSSVLPADAEDAYYLAGWISIHNDDHSGAYRIWRRGAENLPSSDLLRRQNKKRLCWDSPPPSPPAPALLPGLVGAAPVPTLSDLEPFSVPPSTPCPALALFDPASQNRRLVFRSPPVLTKSECAAVSAHVDSFIASERGGVWGTVRKSSVKTTDVAVEDIPVLRPWLNELLLSRLYPLIAEAYPTLADGSSTLSPDGTSRVRVHDAFIVRYDADNDKSFHLPEHSDTSAVSFTVALNDHSEFEGGGTWFEALGGEGGEGMVVDCDVGEACAFAGPMRHAGYPITKGVRLILVLFLYVEDFKYGEFVKSYMDAGFCGDCSKSGSRAVADEKSGVKPSGDKTGGYVVYRETVDLSNMLNRIEQEEENGEEKEEHTTQPKTKI